ncbi:hypothetical protein [Flexithrix dorotheae]|uniref:hypothetical protein n=1 Tax=Flexithrix dorotheae TaxID=70993 RepID=UPI0012FCCBBA|nr:hypothetical protein [Flexithrix dorotheae]
MSKIQVHFKPFILLKVLQITIAILLFIFLLYGAEQADARDDNKTLIKAFLMILATTAVAVFFEKSDIILSPKKYLTMDSKGLSIQNKKGLVKVYFWKDITKVFLIFKGVRFYQVLLFSDGKELEFEFSEKWFFSAFNSSKGLKHNHNKLMNYYGDLKEFTDKIDMENYNELLKEYSLPNPGWFERRNFDKKIRD